MFNKVIKTLINHFVSDYRHFFQAVVSNLDSNNVMIILDNHISKPGWCCSDFDGNGFFGDVYFKPEMWLKGLTKVATMFNLTKNVVGMSLRNELRGPKQNSNDWYRYKFNYSGFVSLYFRDSLVMKVYRKCCSYIFYFV